MWDKNLPSNLIFNQKNLYAWNSLDQLDPFLMIHTWYHQVYCDLYRILVPGAEYASKKLIKDSPSHFLVQCRIEYFNHAAQLSYLWQEVLEMKANYQCCDEALATCAYLSSRLQIQRFNEVSDSERQIVKEDVTKNLRANLLMLRGLYQNFPPVGMLVSLLSM